MYIYYTCIIIDNNNIFDLLQHEVRNQFIRL